MSGEQHMPEGPSIVPHSAVVEGPDGRRFQFQYETGREPSLTEIIDPVCIGEDDALVESRRPSWLRKATVAVIAGAATVGLIVGVNACSSNDSERASDKTEETAPGVSETEKACETEMFPNGPFFANEEASPGDLHTTPTSGNLENMNNLNNYFFEDKDGITCNSALSLSVMTAVYENMVGEGAAKARGFDTQASQVAQSDFYVDKPEEAQKDAQELARFMATRAELNKDPISDAYFKVDRIKEGDKWVAVFKPVDITVDGPDKVWVINGGGYEGSGGDPNQKLLIDKVTGQFYVLNAIGKIPVQEPEQTDQPNPAGEQAPNPQENLGDNSQDQDDQNNGDNRTTSGRNRTGVDGGGGSGVSGGTGGGTGGGDGGDCGGGCEGGNGGNGDGGHDGGGETSTTHPPQTTVPRPTTTVPRSTTTVPPTTQPKGQQSTTTLPTPDDAGGWR
jgi:hypothetical protein